MVSATVRDFIFRQFREHGQTKDFAAEGFGDGKIAGVITEIGIRFLERHKGWIDDLRADSLFRQTRLQRVAVPGENGVEIVGMRAIGRAVRRFERQPAQEFVVEIRPMPALRDPAVEVAELTRRMAA